MSIYPHPDKLDALESKYALVIIAAKRARQLKDGARLLIDTDSTNPLTIALEEIAAGAIVQRVVENAQVTAHLAALRPAEPSLEDIIGAGPVLAMESDPGSPASQLAAALRAAEPDGDDDDMSDDDNEGDEAVTPVDQFVMTSPGLSKGNGSDDDEENDDEIIPAMPEDDE